ncbi:hypothetical protein [Filimonas effusa]|uniref:Uncharacterized protein n=1 Tax=Filimonas effusa TaxID=2508721 RepID=A0A4Q1D927_9BACT|nr:hypothetical protein [Filimonas effusa]RXK85821.1 hypothetical protein ESB13_03140 [Filimonas effusa]
MKNWCILILTILCFTSKGNDSLPVSQVLQRIRSFQTQSYAHFPAGMFPSYREYHGRREVFKDDDNIFFTGLIVVTLKELKPLLSESDRLVVDSICHDAAPLYSLFQNNKGRGTYNFWRTNPRVVFPNGGWLNLMDNSQSLPDDMDDTVILLRAQDAPDSVVRKVYQQMQLHLNAGSKRKKNIRADYKDIAAYSTWFGKRMPTDLDVCVLSNVLHFLYLRNVPTGKADSASLKLICTAIDNGDIRIRPSYISPHYARTPLILYHIARLMTAAKIEMLEQRKAVLIAEARHQLAIARDPMDKVILGTALLKWGVMPPAVHVNTKGEWFEALETTDFAFFVANMTSILPDPFRQATGKLGLGKFYYYAPAYNNLLFLEYLLLCRRHMQAGRSAELSLK